LGLDAGGAEAVGEPDREVVRHTRPVQPEACDGPERKLRTELAIVEPRRDQLVVAELLWHVDLEEPELADPRGLHRTDEHMPAAVLLSGDERNRPDEQERMADVGG